MTERAKINLYHGDCIEAMRAMQDNTYELAIVDPPYGIEKGVQATSRVAKYGQMRSVNDMKVDGSYVQILKRISKNQIVWGFNHLADLLGPTKEFVFWYKHQPVVSYSDGELAWTSFTKTAKVLDLPYFGTVNADLNRIHPTQKPVKLYKWLLSNYANPGDKILDTHLGSGSIAIACHDMGFDLDAWEVDLDYYTAAVKRFNQHAAQLQMF